MYSSLSSATHHIFSPPRLQVVAFEQDANRLPAYPRHQLSLHRFFHQQTHRPSCPSFRRLAAHHGDDALFLTRLQQFGVPRPLLLIQHPLQAAVTVSLRDGSDLSGTFPYDWTYPSHETDLFNPDNDANTGGAIPVQFPPPSFDMSNAPPAVAYVLKYADPRSGVTRLPECPAQKPK